MKGKYLIKASMVTPIMTSPMPTHLGFTMNERPLWPTKWVLKALKWVFGCWHKSHQKSQRHCPPDFLFHSVKLAQMKDWGLSATNQRKLSFPTRSGVARLDLPNVNDTGQTKLLILQVLVGEKRKTTHHFLLRGPEGKALPSFLLHVPAHYKQMRLMICGPKAHETEVALVGKDKGGFLWCSHVWWEAH